MRLIDRIKKLTYKFIRNTTPPMIDIVRVDDIPASDVGESLSGTGATSRSGDPLIIAGKCSGFDTELITQTAALQMQKGGGG